VIVKVTEEKPVVIKEYVPVYVPQEKESKSVEKKNVPSHLTMLIHIENQRVKEHGILSPGQFGYYSLVDYERRHGYTTIYIYSSKWNATYRLDLPHKNGEFSLTGYLLKK